VTKMPDPVPGIAESMIALSRAEQTRNNFVPQPWRVGPERLWPTRHPETIEEVERLRAAERRIAATTGWNSSTMVIGRLLQRLRSDHCEG
jgi:hypothetical protein